MLARLLAAGALAAAVLSTSGCFSPPEPLCAFACAVEPHHCPSGYQCRDDGYCHKTGSSGVCPGLPMLDGAVDAPPSSDGPPSGDGPMSDGPPIDGPPIDGPPIDASTPDAFEP